MFSCRQDEEVSENQTARVGDYWEVSGRSVTACMPVGVYVRRKWENFKEFTLKRKRSPKVVDLKADRL